MHKPHANATQTKLARVRVLIAERDQRTASLVNRILFSFGFRNIACASSGKDALRMLRSQHFDLIITEQEMSPIDGLELVRAIRAAKDDRRIRRDIPIVMMTARTELDVVRAARDAGISEFIAKPFSAKTVSERIIQIIDNPRSFVETPVYIGPDRRRRMAPGPEGERRRFRLFEEMLEVVDAKPVTKPRILPPNYSIRRQISPAIAAEIINEMAVAEAQFQIRRAESEFLEWARDDIEALERAFLTLADAPFDGVALQALEGRAYAIKSQAGIFGYELGTEVGGMLVDYLRAHGMPSGDDLLVIRKHIDTISIIFQDKIKDGYQEIGRDLLTSLQKLIAKLG